MLDKLVLQCTPAELHASVRSFIKEALELGEQSKAVCQKLEHFGASGRPTHGVLLADKALSHWMRGVERQATRENSQGVEVEISMAGENLNYPYGVPDRGDGFSRGEENPRDYRDEWIDAESSGVDAQLAVLDAMLEKTNFEKMAEALKSQAGSLVDAGYRDAADRIARFVGLVGHCPDRATLTGKGLSFAQYGGGSREGMDRYDLMSEIRNIIGAFHLAEADTGIEGLASALDDIGRSLFRIPSHQDIPTRTRFGTPGVLEAVMFKNKTRFEIESGRADALLSFIAQYGSVELPNLNVAA